MDQTNERIHALAETLKIIQRNKEQDKVTSPAIVETAKRIMVLLSPEQRKKAVDLARALASNERNAATTAPPTAATTQQYPYLYGPGGPTIGAPPMSRKNRRKTRKARKARKTRSRR